MQAKWPDAKMSDLLAGFVLKRPGRSPEGTVVFGASYEGAGTRLDARTSPPLGTPMAGMKGDLRSST